MGCPEAIVGAKPDMRKVRHAGAYGAADGDGDAVTVGGEAEGDGYRGSLSSAQTTVGGATGQAPVPPVVLRSSGSDQSSGVAQL